MKVNNGLHAAAGLTRGRKSCVTLTQDAGWASELAWERWRTEQSLLISEFDTPVDHPQKISLFKVGPKNSCFMLFIGDSYCTDIQTNFVKHMHFKSTPFMYHCISFNVIIYYANIFQIKLLYLKSPDFIPISCSKSFIRGNFTKVIHFKLSSTKRERWYRWWQVRRRKVKSVRKGYKLTTNLTLMTCRYFHLMFEICFLYRSLYTNKISALIFNTYWKIKKHVHAIDKLWLTVFLASTKGAGPVRTKRNFLNISV
jgi:hypothetical protein